MTRPLQHECRIECRFDVHFTRYAFSPANPLLHDLLLERSEDGAQVVVLVDGGLTRAQPGLTDEIAAYFTEGDMARHFRLALRPLVVAGGEACKNDPALLEQLYAQLAERHVGRQAWLIAVGGGALLDLAGYVAATTHGGLRLLRLPSTVLAQGSAGLELTASLNFHGRKDFMRCFAPPGAVVNDEIFLRSLPERERRAGIAEALRVALVDEPDFFQQLYARRQALARGDRQAITDMIARSARLHLRRVGLPATEAGPNPLELGQWAALHLEELTNGGLHHGEAVALGVALDVLYSHQALGLTQPETTAVFELLLALGFEVDHSALAGLDVSAALAAYREHGGGRYILLPGLGEPRAVTRIDADLMARCVDALLHIDPHDLPALCRLEGAPGEARRRA